MSKHKENPVESAPASTPITNVIAKVVEAKNPLESAEPSSTEPPEYAAAIAAVKAAVEDYCRSTWRLAWALMDFRAVHERVHPSDRLTDRKMATTLAIRLSTARIGQLVNTALSYHRGQVDEAIEFRVYEMARVKYPRATPEKRLAIVKKHPTTTAMAKVKSASGQKKKTRHELIIRITPAAEQDADPVINVRINGEPGELPAELERAICEHANKLFSKTKNDDQ